MQKLVYGSWQDTVDQSTVELTIIVVIIIIIITTTTTKDDGWIHGS